MWMPIVLGNTTITGLSAGGLPTASISTSSFATGAITRDKIAASFGHPLQIVQSVKTDRSFVTTATGDTAIPGLSASINRQSQSTSRILIIFDVKYDHTQANGFSGFRIFRNGSHWTPASGDAAGGRYTVINCLDGNANADQSGKCCAHVVVDSPTDVSGTLTYQIYVYKGAANQLSVNRPRYDDSGGGQTDDGVYCSSLTLIELAN
jgi:hypothetical protein